MNEPIAIYRRNPMAAIGSRFAPLADPLVALEWPYCYWLGTDREPNAIAWGHDIWSWSSMTAESRVQDGMHRYTIPADDPERVRWTDSFNKVSVSSAIDANWRAWEVSRVHVPFNHVGVLEKYPTSIDQVIALDTQGNPIYSFGPQNGAHATRYSVLHPTQGVGSLEWMWRITVTSEGHNAPYLERLVASLANLGRDVVEPWQHQSNGSELNWAHEQQVIVPSASVVRMFVCFRGPVDRFAIVAGGRLSGYVQQGGHEAAAANSATRRTG